MTEEQLTALLRIKRFEQPPPQYFDRLLENIHRRQREELLHRPLWRIAAGAGTSEKPGAATRAASTAAIDVKTVPIGTRIVGPP